MYLTKYIVHGEGNIITLSNDPFIWLFDRNNSSISNEDNTFRWDIDGKPSTYKPIILWKPKNNDNQTAFTIQDNGDLQVLGKYNLTIKQKHVVYGDKTDINLKIHPAHSPVLQGNTSIKFVSYNILTGLPEFEHDFKQYINTKFTAWGKGREKLVQAEVLKADIAVIVECTKSQLAYIVQGNDKFKAHIELKIDEADGTAILYDKSRFRFVNKHKAQLTNKGGQIVFNVILLDLHTQKMFCVTGLHLKSKDDAIHEKRRVHELQSALLTTNKFIAEYGDIPQVLSGDLNSDSNLYYNNYSNLNETVVSLLTKHGYTNVGVGDTRLTYYFWQKSIYDYIFIKGDITAYAYDVDDVYTLCPNAQQGSDHLAVRCNLVLTQ
jgi:endonuclease/exonuclease/phosphatase family metal-dependent hydrolase